MKISKKTSYGLRFMLCLAATKGEDFAKLTDVAAKEGIPEKFLENIVAIIRPSGLLSIKRGSAGGYKLSRPPQQIKLKQLFEVLEGNVFQYEDNEQDDSKITPAHQVITNLWRSMEEIILNLLTSMTLEDLLAEYQKKNSNIMFYI